MRLAALILAWPAALPAQWEMGGVAGFGAYRNGSVIAPGGTARAGVRNRFAVGAVIGEQVHRRISGEIRYLYQDGDPFVSAGSVRSNIQGQSHAFHYDVLVHGRGVESRWRPFASAGVGAKWYVTTQAAPLAQPLQRIATLNGENQVSALVVVGGGVRYELRPGLRLRVELRDYITPFPNRIISPAGTGTGRGILHQFTPLVGIGAVF